MLRISNLSVNYDHIVALEDVSFFVEKGSIVSIIGSNGAGKSTLINTISGVVRRKSGEILLDGRPLPAAAHKVVREGVVQVPEGRHVFPNLTVAENLVMGGARRSAKDAARKIPEMYQLFPILGERKKQMAGTLSGGEQQMLAIARGLMAEPEILLLDEPSLGLAPIIVNQVFKIIRRINDSGITVLLVEQNASKAMAISDYTYVLENGKVVREGASRELRNDPQIQSAYLGETREDVCR
ncbi:MAG: ABC transporter ATP-binding protein [Clostridiales bacterium]|nr:ABC transporter ATP-binding protein [Clostridiales bacterium]